MCRHAANTYFTHYGGSSQLKKSVFRNVINCTQFIGTNFLAFFLEVPLLYYFMYSL